MSGPPASRRPTLEPASADNLLATTHPAEPAPMIKKSNSIRQNMESIESQNSQRKAHERFLFLSLNLSVAASLPS